MLWATENNYTNISYSSSNSCETKFLSYNINYVKF